MTFAPIILSGGVSGYRFLSRTLDQQQAAHSQQPSIKRDIAYFKDQISHIANAEDLVKDPVLLRVALTAYGLEGDQNKQFFIRRVLEGGTSDNNALAVRLVDSRYREIANAFGFGDQAGGNVRLSGFADTLSAKYARAQFEISVGQQDTSQRLALQLERDIGVIATSENVDRSGWFSVLGSPPLRQVFETAFGLSSQFNSLDLDSQKVILEDRNLSLTGSKSLSIYGNDAQVDVLTERFLSRQSVDQSISSPLLSLFSQASASNSVSLIQNIITSNAQFFSN